jgi:hypothetical protein
VDCVWDGAWFVSQCGKVVGSEEVDASKCECGKFVVVWGVGVDLFFIEKSLQKKGKSVYCNYFIITLYENDNCDDN